MGTPSTTSVLLRQGAVVEQLAVVEVIEQNPVTELQFNGMPDIETEVPSKQVFW